MLRKMMVMMLVAAGSVHAQTATEAFSAVDKSLTETLAKPYSGDVDLDFLTRMVAQHDAAIERAKAALANSTDAKVRMMAGDMLKSLHAEQRTMKEWLSLYGPKEQAAQPAPMPKALPVAMPAADKMTVAATRPVSRTVVSATIVPVEAVSESVPPADVVSDSVAVPNVPAPDEAIENTAPKMEFLDGGV